MTFMHIFSRQLISWTCKTKYNNNNNKTNKINKQTLKGYLKKLNKYLK